MQIGDSGLPWVRDDGGRSAAGYKGSVGDCAARALSIASGMGYQAAYDLINRHAAKERPSKRRRGKSNARTGVHSVTMRRVMEELGWRWVPTTRIGSGCKVHLAAGELPCGRLIVLVSKHYTAMIDGVIHDTFDPQRRTIEVGAIAGEPYRREFDRCVYGYWVAP